MRGGVLGKPRRQFRVVDAAATGPLVHVRFRGSGIALDANLALVVVAILPPALVRLLCGLFDGRSVVGRNPLTADLLHVPAAAVQLAGRLAGQVAGVITGGGKGGANLG